MREQSDTTELEQKLDFNIKLNQGVKPTPESLDIEQTKKRHRTWATSLLLISTVIVLPKLISDNFRAHKNIEQHQQLKIINSDLYKLDTAKLKALSEQKAPEVDIIYKEDAELMNNNPRLRGHELGKENTDEGKAEVLDDYMGDLTFTRDIADGKTTGDDGMPQGPKARKLAKDIIVHVEKVKQIQAEYDQVLAHQDSLLILE